MDVLASAVLGLIRLTPDHDVNAISCMRLNSHHGLAEHAKWNYGEIDRARVVLISRNFLVNAAEFGLYRPCPWQHDLC